MRKKCPFHDNTGGSAVTTINMQDGCTHAASPVMPNAVDVNQLSPADRKKEYYYLLLQVLPAIMEILRKIRKEFPHGLVEYASGTSELVSAIGRGKFAEQLAKATEEKNFLLGSYWIHNAIAVTVDIATELWAKNCDWSSTDMARLAQLVDSQRQALYGQKAAQKRIASAMIQTMHISASFERFIYNFVKEKYDRQPSEVEMLELHHCSLKSAAHLTELHLERTRQIRSVLGAEMEEGGIVHRYINTATFSLSEHGLELHGDVMAKFMESLPIDASDGRVGCPGKKHIPEIWHWIEELSVLYSYPILAAK